MEVTLALLLWRSTGCVWTLLSLHVLLVSLNQRVQVAVDLSLVFSGAHALLANVASSLHPLVLLTFEAWLVLAEATTFKHLTFALLRLELSKELLLLTLSLSLGCSLKSFTRLLIWFGTLLMLLELVLSFLLQIHW